MNKKTGLLIIAVWAMLLSILFCTSAVCSGRRRSELAVRYGKLDFIRETIMEDYYEEVKEEALIEGAIRGMTSVLQDPYTFYYTPEEMQRHNDEVNGDYRGVGMLVQNNSQGMIEVIRVYEDSPAQRGGVCAGDCLLAVDGVNVYGSDIQGFREAVKQIQGEPGTELTITVRREDKVLDLTLVRGNVHISNINSAMLEEGIGYIAIAQFDGDAVEGFRKALSALHEEGMESLVIDLRNNPGGSLDDVVAIADLLLPEGVVVYTEDRAGDRIDYTSDNKYDPVPLAILINNNSASASEILAASVQDYHRGTIVGTRSFGKGIVQTLIRFGEDGAGFQYTSSTYFSPKGSCIHGYGVTPDLVVEGDVDFWNAAGIPEVENDLQLQAAIAELKK